MKVRKLEASAILLMSIALIAAAPRVEAKNRFNNAQVQQVILGNFATTQQQLRSQISTYLANGQLTQAQASGFTAQLDQLAATSTSASTDPYQTQSVVNQFNSIGSQINTSLSAPGSFHYSGVPYNSYLSRNGVSGRWNHQFWAGNPGRHRGWDKHRDWHNHDEHRDHVDSDRNWDGHYHDDDRHHHD